MQLEKHACVCMNDFAEQPLCDGGVKAKSVALSGKATRKSDAALQRLANSTLFRGHAAESPANYRRPRDGLYVNRRVTPTANLVTITIWSSDRLLSQSWYVLPDA